MNHEPLGSGANPAPLGTPPLAGLNILLAEDHPLSRKLCLHVLKALGASAEVAANGLETVAAVQAKAYDLVLMDCNMPVMDGFQATAAIRAWESAGGTGRSHPLWIVALTANARLGERDRCLAAGMNDYLSKPFTQADLRNVLLKAPAPPPAGALAPPVAVLNPGRLEQLDNELDADSVRTMVEEFLAELPVRVARLKNLLATAPWPETAREAHSLKGSSASFGLESLAAKFQALEELADGGGGPAAGRLLGEVVSEAQTAVAALKAWLAGRPPR